MTDRELLDEAMSILSDAMQYVTWNECNGNKCRTPGCHSCGAWGDPDEVDERYSNLKKAIKDRPAQAETKYKKELRENVRTIFNNLKGDKEDG